jgi:hypothetical protein
LTYLHNSPRFSREAYEAAFTSFFHHTWSAKPRIDLALAENIAEALRRTTITAPSNIQYGEPRWRTAFTDDEISEIIKNANSTTVKDELKRVTAECVTNIGAFGAPWFWVINSERSPDAVASGDHEKLRQSSGEHGHQKGSGRVSEILVAGRQALLDQKRLPRQNTAEPYGEPFFGSDRWAVMWDFLGIPYQDLKILPGRRSDADSSTSGLLRSNL